MEDVLDPALLSLRVSGAAVGISAAVALPLAVWCGRSHGFAAELVVFLARVLMALPTVVAGLLVYALLSRRGPLGGSALLFTPGAIVVGEVFLAVPMITALGAAAVRSLDPRFRDVLATCDAGGPLVVLLTVREAAPGIVAAVVAAFGRCITELGVALLVGGSLAGRTRTLPAAIALETSRGADGRALALGGVLLGIALVVTAALHLLERRARTS